MSLISTNVHILKEAYFGGSKQLKEAERLIDSLILIAKQKQDEPTFKLSESPTNKKLENVLASQFGVKSIKLYWCRTPDARIYTRPYITQFSGISEYINKKNYKLTKVFKNKDKEIFITGTDSLLTDADLSSQEILAIILHEIGHNFDTTALRMITGLPLFWISKFVSNAAKRFDERFDNIVRKHSKFYDPLMNYFFLFSKEMSFLRPILNLLPKNTTSQQTQNKQETPMKWMYTFMGFIGSFPSYGSERFSDSFATSYGYGQYLGTALMKLESYYKEDTAFGAIINSTPVLNCMYAYASIFDSIVQSLFTTHPDNGARIKASINKLKRDLNDPSISKELKAQVEKDLAALEDVYNDYLQVEDIPEFRNQVLVAYRMMNEKIFGGKFNIHEILDPIYSRSEV